MRKMNKHIVIAASILMVANVAISQTRNTRTRPPSNSGYGTPANTQKDTTKPKPVSNSGYGAPSNSGYGNQTQTNSGYGNTPAQNKPVNNAKDTTLPYEVVKNKSGGLTDSVKMSLRNDAVIERNLVKDRNPLTYEHIREDDAVYRVRVWREIDAREKLNLPFRYAAVEDNGGQRFISILLKAIREDSVVAFSADDDRFTTPITAAEAMSGFGGGFDTVPKYDMDGNVNGYQIRDKAVEPDSIYKFRIKEEWVFDKEASRMFVRILGIAPVVPFKLSTGEVIPNSERPVFWVYYPDLRPTLSKFEVYNAKNYGARMTWEELFEGRMFTSYITKSTIDNPYDQPLNQYIKDALFRLLEGENIKEKIFSYEQNLWSY
jgi:gliding motility associated protien GldN